MTEPRDPEAPARTRAARLRSELLAPVPMMTIAEAAALLECPEAEIATRAARHELLVMPTDDGPAVPAWQLESLGALLGLPAVLTALASVPIDSPWILLAWLVAPLDRDDP